MSLSQRLKAAEYDRRLAAGLPVDHLSRPAVGEQARVDVRKPDAPVVDLTEGPWADVIEMGDGASMSTPPSVDEPTPQHSLDEPVDEPVSIGPQVGQRSRLECPQCGGPTQVDLVDPVGHTVSLSCLSCYHMFRVEA